LYVVLYYQNFLTLMDLGGGARVIIHAIMNILICNVQFTTRYWNCGRI